MVATEQSRKLGEQLREHFLAQKIDQTQASKRYKVSQGWVSRIFDGEFSARSSVARRMCEDARIPFLAVGPERERPLVRNLKRELLATWDGSQAEAEQITQILRALKALKDKKGRS